jgi:hypothetical protein
MPEVAQQSLFRIDSLDELPSLVAKHNASSPTSEVPQVTAEE